MKFWKEATILQFIGSCIWNTCESLHTALGKYGPTVFGWMVGRKGKKY